jgi:hypothetical protein
VNLAGLPPGTKDWGPEALHQLRDRREQQQDNVAEHRDDWIRSNRYYYDRIKRLLRFIVERGRRVLDVRCQTRHTCWPPSSPSEA